MSLYAAVKLARANPHVHKFKMGCIITDNYRYFNGWNRFKTHPLAVTFFGNPKKLCLHCELDALRQAVRSDMVPGRATVYIARVLKDGTPALAKPCEGCFNALTEFGFNNIRWTQ